MKSTRIERGLCRAQTKFLTLTQLFNVSLHTNEAEEAKQCASY